MGSSETTPSVLTTTTINYTLYSNITGGREEKYEEEQEQTGCCPLQAEETGPDPLRPQHSQLREPGEKTDSDGPPESLHPGSPHLTVTPHSTSFLPIFY